MPWLAIETGRNAIRSIADLIEQRADWQRHNPSRCTAAAKLETKPNKIEHTVELRTAKLIS